MTTIDLRTKLFIDYDNHNYLESIKIPTYLLKYDYFDILNCKTKEELYNLFIFFKNDWMYRRDVKNIILYHLILLNIDHKSICVKEKKDLDFISLLNEIRYDLRNKYM